jgi:hypothetical protein
MLSQHVCAVPSASDAGVRRRPTYRVTCDDGAEAETTDEHLYDLPEPKSELLPDAASPPAIAAPPPQPALTAGPGGPGAHDGDDLGGLFGAPSSAAPPPTAGARAAAAGAPALPFAHARLPPGAAALQPSCAQIAHRFLLPLLLKAGHGPHICASIGAASGMPHSACTPSRPIWAGSTSAPGAAPPRGSHVGEPDFVPSLAAVTEAHKLAKSAASSLTFEDVHTSVRLLGEALALLTRPPPAR